MKKRHKKKASISLCMIVKNEEHDLPRCLQSARGLVDEMIVVDTGSTDRTAQVAREQGARVFEFAWTGDFAAARNHSISHASSSWILFLDADEQLEVRQHKAIRRRLADATVEGLSFLVENLRSGSGGSSTHYVVRLFRNRAGISFSGPIHESVTPGRNYHFTNFRIYHHGYILDARGKNAKIEREEATLVRLTREEPGTLEWFMYLFRNYMNQARHRDILSCYQQNLQHITAHQEHPSYPIVQYLVALSHYKLEQVDPLRELLGRMQQRYPEQLDFQFLAGLSFHHAGDMQRARQGFERYLRLSAAMARDPAMRRGQQLIFNEGNERVAQNFLARIHTELGQYDEATQLLQQLLQQDEQNQAVLLNLAQVQRLRGEAEAARQTCQRVLALDPNSAGARKCLDQLDHEAAAPPAPAAALDGGREGYLQLVAALTYSHLDPAEVDAQDQAHHCQLGLLAAHARGDVLDPLCHHADLALALAARRVRYHGLFTVEAEHEGVLERCRRAFVANCAFASGSLEQLASWPGRFDTLVLRQHQLEQAALDPATLESMAATLRPRARVLVALAAQHEQPLPVQQLLAELDFGATREALPWAEAGLLVLDRDGDGDPSEQDPRRDFELRPVLPPLDREQLVSIIIPAAPGCAGLEQALDSALDQTYPCCEVLVACHDPAPEVERLVQQRGEPARLVRAEAEGQAAAVNAGLAASQGQAVCLLTAQDQLLPGKVELQQRLLQSEPKLQLAHSDGYLSEQDGARPGYYWRAPQLMAHELLVEQLRGNVVLTPTVMVRRACLDQAAGLHAALAGGADYDCWLRLIQRQPVGALNVPTAMAGVPGGLPLAQAEAARQQHEREVLRRAATRLDSGDLAAVDSVENQVMGAFTLGVELGLRGLNAEAAQRLDEAAALLRYRRFSPEHRLYHGASQLRRHLAQQGDAATVEQALLTACGLMNIFFIAPDAIEAYQQAREFLPGLDHPQPDLEQAVPALLTALERDPEFPTAVQDLAAAYLDLDRAQEAAALYRRLARLRPNLPLAPINLAMIHIASDDLDGAREQLQQACMFEDLDLNELQQLVDIQTDLCIRAGDEDPTPALALAQQLARRYPLYERDLQLKEGEVLARFNRVDQAHAMLHQLHGEGHVDQRLINNLATLNQIRGDLKQAAQLFSEGCEKFPGNETLLRNYVLLAVELEQLQQAHDAIAHSPLGGRPDFQLMQAKLLMGLGEAAAARGILEQLLQQFPDAEEVLQLLGQLEN